MWTLGYKPRDSHDYISAIFPSKESAEAFIQEESLYVSSAEVYLYKTPIEFPSPAQIIDGKSSSDIPNS